MEGDVVEDGGRQWVGCSQDGLRLDVACPRADDGLTRQVISRGPVAPTAVGCGRVPTAGVDGQGGTGRNGGRPRNGIPRCTSARVVNGGGEGTIRDKGMTWRAGKVYLFVGSNAPDAPLNLHAHPALIPPGSKELAGLVDGHGRIHMIDAIRFCAWQNCIVVQLDVCAPAQAAVPAVGHKDVVKLGA